MTWIWVSSTQHRTYDNLAIDMAYYVSDEGTYNGSNFSKDSVRYSYDVVDETGDGYEERNQDQPPGHLHH
ncbi:MAG: hypothetical protein R2860_10730 [Desulfobacterales bacterium]